MVGLKWQILVHSVARPFSPCRLEEDRKEPGNRGYAPGECRIDELLDLILIALHHLAVAHGADRTLPALTGRAPRTICPSRVSSSSRSSRHPAPHRRSTRPRAPPCPATSDTASCASPRPAPAAPSIVMGENADALQQFRARLVDPATRAGVRRSAGPTWWRTAPYFGRSPDTRYSAREPVCAQPP